MPLEWLGLFSDFDDTEFGMLVRAWLAYVMTGSVPSMPDRALAVALKTMTTKADYYIRKFNEVSEKRKQAGASGGKAKQANLANANISNQSNQIISNHITQKKEKKKEEESEFSTGFSTGFSTDDDIDWLNDGD